MTEHIPLGTGDGSGGWTPPDNWTIHEDGGLEITGAANPLTIRRSDGTVVLGIGDAFAALAPSNAYITLMFGGNIATTSDITGPLDALTPPAEVIMFHDPNDVEIAGFNKGLILSSRNSETTVATIYNADTNNEWLILGDPDGASGPVPLIQLLENVTPAQGTADGSASGEATLSGGTVTVNHGNINAFTRIFLTPQTAGAHMGNVYISARVDDTSFTITSTDALDDRDIAWFLMEPT